MGLIFTMTLFLGSHFTFAQDSILFKKIDTIELYLEVYRPINIEKRKNRSAMIFFFGGGWINGDKKQFKMHAKHFQKQGIMCFLADYRTSKKHGSSPFDALEDAKSAVRYLRKDAKRLYIDPDKIVAVGGSAGGHLALSCALLTEFNSTDDDLSVSAIPNAIVLFNPVLDNGPGGYGYKRIGIRYKQFSPLHNLKENSPPMCILSGTEDELIPKGTLQYFKMKMELLGNRCDLHLYKNQKHGFFNFNNSKYYIKTVKKTERFLYSLGLLTKGK